MKDRVVMAVVPKTAKPEEVGPNGEWPVYESFASEADLKANERLFGTPGHYRRRVISIPPALSRFQEAMKALLRAELRARGL